MQNNQDKEQVLKIYELYLNSIEKISDRRGRAINHFITINSAILLGVGFLMRYLAEYEYIDALLSGLLFTGFCLCILFYRIIGSYKAMNSIKFEVLNKIEKDFFSVQPYTDEYNLMKQRKSNRLSGNEKYIFVLFGVMYLIGIFLFYGFDEKILSVIK
ncbi:MAG: hypothetical protein F4X82_01250 [Candidatus Spechtbacteria bacterium SB0662_bin_43]|uniref:Uncharacterized protein n=1 Tax=Candidatus Spechtbacteria bacterium SB0662_bin_43 TaxID=2604897 RepID=A0A845DDW5_9BACT|nr:hypothetical protein [Candidatus Spechtbacteria bacterium SB0662_bin_43]